MTAFCGVILVAVFGSPPEMEYQHCFSEGDTVESLTFMLRMKYFGFFLFFYKRHSLPISQGADMVVVNGDAISLKKERDV